MNAIDFKQLRRLEKQRLRKELLREKKEIQEQTLDKHCSSNITTITTNTIDAAAVSSSSNHDSATGASSDTYNSCSSQFQFSGNCTHVNLIDILEQSRIVSIRGDSTMEIMNDSENVNMRESPSNVYYMQHFLTDEYTNNLIQWLHHLPHASHDTDNDTTNQDHYNGKWTRLKFSQRNVALVDFGCYANPRTNIIPPLLEKLAQTLVDIQAFPPSHPPNHVLINEYQGHEGILPHTDGPIYLDRTATFSIASGDVLFHFTERTIDNDNNHGNGNGSVNETNKRASVMQVKLHGNGSLVVFTNDAYTNHCHSIDDRIHDLVEYAGRNCANAPMGEAVQRGHRISLTFRHKFPSP